MFNNTVPTKKIVISAGLILFVFLIIIFIIRPNIIGYGIYQQMKSSNISVEDYGKKIHELESKILVSDTNLSSCILFSNKFSIELGKCMDKFFACEEDKLDFSISANDYEETIKNLQDDLGERDKNVDDLQNQFDLLVDNMVNNICCKAKIDNPNIDSYILENNKIICLEEGELKISC